MEIETDAFIRKVQHELPYNTTHFEELLKYHYSYVSQICSKFFGDDATAEELTQEIFLKVFHQLEKFSFKSSFKTWIYRIAMNTCIDHFKKVQSERKKIENFMEFQKKRERDIGEGILARDIIFTTLSSLSDSERELIAMRHMANMSFSEISAELSISESAAKMRLARASEKFKDIYQNLSFLIIFCDFF